MSIQTSNLLEKELESLFDKLWPINRSITGNGNRESLKILSEIIDLKITEISSGSKVFDWTIPKEWNVRNACILDSNGQKILDFSDNNLHLVGYSKPIDQWLTYEELVPNIHTLIDQPDLIPYITSYYKERWGFCMAHNKFTQLDKSLKYRVVIDSSLDPNGSLTYGEAILKGETEEEIVFSTYICHPSMASNELSGPIVTSFLYKELEKMKNRHYTYRFIFTSETIGTIAYLSKNLPALKKNVKAGFVVTCLGDNGAYTYKRAKGRNIEVNEIVEHVLKHHAQNNYKIIPFSPIGSDERQYSSPGINLPFGSLMRTKWGEFKEYHTSADNKSYISFEAMTDTIEIFKKICQAYELNQCYVNNFPFGEPFLSKHQLYPDMGITSGKKENWLEKILFVLNYSDGNTKLLEIAETLNISLLDLSDTISQLQNKSIISKI